MSSVRIFGRSSSHFTRCVRIFAHELGIAYQLVPALNLLSQEVGDYGGNPALKLPTLETETGSWFGALNICRELARRAHAEASIVWPEDLRDGIAANAQELVLQGMSTEVSLIMGASRDAASESPYAIKSHAGLRNSLAWLEEQLPHTLSQLPPNRRLSFFEVTLFCLGTHLRFRDVLDTAGFPLLQVFWAEFAERGSAQSTEYRFDAR